MPRKHGRTAGLISKFAWMAIPFKSFRLFRLSSFVTTVHNSLFLLLSYHNLQHSSIPCSLSPCSPVSKLVQRIPQTITLQNPAKISNRSIYGHDLETHANGSFNNSTKGSKRYMQCWRSVVCMFTQNRKYFRRLLQKQSLYEVRVPYKGSCGCSVG